MRNILICLLMLSLCGCLAEVTVVRNPDTGYTEASYKRWGNQEIGSFTLNLDGTVSFDKQKSDNTAMYETFNKLIDRIP